MQTAEKLERPALRRSDRIAKQVAILLIGSDPWGKEFVEQTRTVVLSRHGAGIVSKNKLAVEQELFIVHQESKKETQIRVVGHIGNEGASYTYGVAFVDPAVNFWSVEFPAAPQLATPDAQTRLQCSACGRAEFADFGVLESDIYAIHEGILRSCKTCSGLTLWKQSPAGTPAVPEPTVVSSVDATQTQPPPPPAPFKNRRRHVRIKVNFSASVRTQSLDADTVLCENVSRGGLCFKSDRHYHLAAGIEVAAPYSPGSPCILVPGQIVYVQELPDEKMFRYGVQYLDLTKDARS